MNTKTHISRRLTTLFIVLALLGGAFYSGYQYGYGQKKVAYIEEAINTTPTDGIDADFSLLWEAWNLVRQTHIKGEETDNQELLYGTVRGLVNSFDDPHSIFLTPKESEKFEEDIRGKFGGVGMEIGIRNNQLVVIAPLKNTPAERAGLRASDKILKVDETFADALTINEAVQLIRGEPGSAVMLMIFREGWREAREISVTREIIQIPTLDYELKDNSIAYIQLYSFNENAPSRFYDAALNTLNDGAKGIILDLRNNPGGYLEVAVNIASWFVDEGETVVSEVFRSGEEHAFAAQRNGALKPIPVVVLVNEGSASASEILAGALRDIRNVELIGEKTYGKGSVQELKTLSDGSTLKLTVARWVLPSGAVIEGEGLEPDIVVEITDEDFENERDPQLEKALELIKERI